MTCETFGGMSFGIGHLFTGKPTKHVENCFFALECVKQMVSKPVALAKVSQTFSFGWIMGKSAPLPKAIGERMRHKNNI